VGDDEYAWMFRQEYPSVLHAVTLVVRDRGRAEELTQDAFVQLFTHWRRVSRYERPEAWVRRVAIRMAVRHARREEARPRLELMAGVTPIERWPDIDLQGAIATLPAIQRAVVSLFYLEDLPIDEIATTLGASRSAVKVNLHRARRRLAEILGEEVSDDVG
jgi:DNA-directed RNA polymerase specialized sigma24 family protein